MTSICCPICGTTILDEDYQCGCCGASLRELKYFSDKSLRTKLEPHISIIKKSDEKARSVRDLLEAEYESQPLYQIYCPNCGARACSYDEKCLICKFPIKATLEEHSEAMLRIDASYAERRRFAISPKTSPALLELLAGDPLPLVRRGVAANPNAPEDVITRFASDHDPSMRAAAASNPQIPEEKLGELALDTATIVKRQVLLNPASAEGAREAALSSMEKTERIALAAEPELPAWILNRLAIDDEASVRKSLAGNISCSSEAFDALKADKEKQVREAVAANPATPPIILVAMSEDDDPKVRCSIAKNPFVPCETREKLASQEDVIEIVVSEIRQGNRSARPTHDDVRKRIFGSGWENRRLASSPLTPLKKLRELAKPGMDNLFNAIIRNPSTPPDVLDEMVLVLDGYCKSGHGSGADFRMVDLADTGKLGEAALHTMAESNRPMVRMAVADDPRLDKETLEALSRDENDKVRARVAKNPNASETILERLAFDRSAEVVSSALYNPQIPKELIKFVYWARPGTPVHVLKARNPDIDPEDLMNSVTHPVPSYQGDERTVERAEAAQNPAASMSFLAALSRDPYLEVRRAVVRNVNAPSRIAEEARLNDAPSPPYKKADSLASPDEDGRWILNNKIQSGNMRLDEDFIVVLKAGGKYLKEALAKYPKLPIYAFEELATDESSGTRKRLASHHCLPSHLQRLLAFDDFVGVREELAKNEYSCPDVLDILRYDVNSTVRRIANRRMAKLLL